MDQHLKTQDHLNNLRAFESYEASLRAAYKRATAAERSTDEPRGRNSQDLRGRVRRHSVEPSPRFGENQSVE